MKLRTYIKWILALSIISLICILGRSIKIEYNPNVIVVDNDRVKKYEETSVKKEIKTQRGDIFIIDSYIDVYTTEKLMDIYQKIEDEKILLIKSLYTLEVDFESFEDQLNNIEGYYVKDTPILLIKMQEEAVYRNINIAKANWDGNKEELSYILPFVYEYMFEVKTGSTRYDAMEFLVANNYEKGIKCLQKWAQGIFENEGIIQCTEQEKVRIIKNSKQVLDNYNIAY